MPEPGQGESRTDFVERCIPIVLEDGTAEDGDQAVAVCNSMWEQAHQTNELRVVTNRIEGATVERVQKHGRAYLVAPVVMLCEGVLIACTACIVSFAFGVTASWCGIGMARYSLVWLVGGLAPPLVVPWKMILLGLGVALAVSIGSALWPAVSVARAEPLRLLQAGRASM